MILLLIHKLVFFTINFIIMIQYKHVLWNPTLKYDTQINYPWLNLKDHGQDFDNSIHRFLSFN